ncbi:MAG: multicopper oxidase domain-containing protein [Tissierellia bacterium]|nr:multicopper oxidase domain-containing protein [Tissierellia bacterium]
MGKNTKWYLIIALSVITIVFFAGYVSAGMGNKFGGGNRTTERPLVSDVQNSGVKLPMLLLLEDKNPEAGKAEFDLVVKYGQHEFKSGYKADTLGYNGDYLGPIIKVTKGDEIRINVNNTLNEPTTVHWHGLEVIGEMDGGPRQVIMPDTMWKPHFTIDQPAATLWYHSHLMDKTGEQVYKGLAGLIYIEDQISVNLDIPKEYGVNDIPLIVQDKRFTGSGDISYDLNMRDIMNGFYGDTVIINGSINPVLDVSNETIRLRLVNASNARTYEFVFSHDQEFFQIASDGGFLKESVELKTISLSPAERAEILLDLSDYLIGDTIVLKDGTNDLMTINIVKETNISSSIPKSLLAFTDYNKKDAVRIRKFVMSGMGPMVTINGKQMDMDVIDEMVKLEELEEWIISNESSGMGMGMGMMENPTPHPFHVHGAQFQVIERNSNPPPLNERGWKDTVLVNHGEEVRILIKFRKEGLFMYHCHILEHEDSGMMGQFLVE